MPSSAATIAQIQELVLSNSDKPIIPIGSRSKPGLSTTQSGEHLCVRELSGVCEYDPSEFLITAKAGTLVSEVQEHLQQHGQYLPFDPLFVEDGATLGGTIASGLTGPESLLYGRLRDFVMEVQFVDGTGAIVRGGGKVVKNAAGFDLPKLFVGSYGRLGILTEITIKVLPRPAATRSGYIQFDSLGDAIRLIQKLAGLPLPIQSLNLSADGRLEFTIAGPENCLPDVFERIDALATSPQASARELTAGCFRPMHPSSDQYWLNVSSDCSNLAELLKLSRNISGCQATATLAGRSTWIGMPMNPAETSPLEQTLFQLGLPAVVTHGAVSDLTLFGNTEFTKFAQRIKQAMDPNERFLNFEPSKPIH